jgi:hypothetical protein
MPVQQTRGERERRQASVSGMQSHRQLHLLRVNQ